MLRKSVMCLLLFASPLCMRAQGNTGMSGTVYDSAGALVAGADITVTNLSSGVMSHAVTDAAGGYNVVGLKAGKYKVVVVKPGFQTTMVASLGVGSGQIVAESVTLQVSSVGSTVTVSGGLSGATEQPTEEDVFESNQQLRVLDRAQIESAGPVAGAAQIVARAPGASVTGYGNTGATKYTVGINGVSQGWGGYGGYSGGGALAITLDGVPLVDPANDLWQSPTIPEQFMIQNVNVTYGPGDPDTRWYNNVGGMIEFTPVQPAAKAHADISATYGSFNQKDLSANLTSGLYHGWSAVIAGGVGDGNDFRIAPDGFQNPGKDVAAYGKAVKSYQQNTFEIAGYYAHGAGYRSQVIPTVANPLITVDGQPGSQQYSQQTSGYFSTLPYASYNKYDTNEDGLIYGREHISLDPTISVDNLTWYNHIARSHYRTQDVYGTGPQQDEWNNPHTDTIGNKLLLTKLLKFNTVTLGGYYIHAMYNSRNNFYNPANGGGKAIANIGGKIRSSYFNQDDFAITLQDQIRLGQRITVTPGLRYVGFSTAYSDNAQQDFNFAPGGILNSHCAATGASTTGNIKDQGSNCGGLENRSGVEPSVNGNVRVLPWLELYGGFMEALRSPQLGGGGGLFQSVQPVSYHLSRQHYSQGGFKIHHEGMGMLNTMLITGTFYYQDWANQEIDTTLANGNSVSANGTSAYKGVNGSFDDDPIARLHVFANMNVETATYTNYTTVVALGSSTPEQNFNGLHVPYVPKSTVNAGAYYDFTVSHGLHVRPMASFQYIGSQYIFNNNGVDSAGNQFPQPSNETMPGYGTVNLGVRVPYKFMELNFNALNVADSRYLIYEYISSGGYFGTTGNGTAAQGAGYILAYPGAPVSLYGGITFHF